MGTQFFILWIYHDLIKQVLITGQKNSFFLSLFYTLK